MEDVEVVSSMNLAQYFEARWSEAAYLDNLETSAIMRSIVDRTFAFMRERVLAHTRITEYDVQQFIVRRFGEEGLTCKGEFPIVGTNEQPADPHFEPTPANARRG